MTTLDKDTTEQAIELLKEASKALERHWFDETGNYNNEQVIDVNQKIDRFLDNLEEVSD